MTIAAVGVGIITGFLAWIFKHLTSLIASIFLPHISSDGLNWWIIVVPVAGILLTGIFTRYIIHTNLTHVVAQLLMHLRHRDYNFLPRRAVAPLFGGSITLGMGGSSGAEGPIAATGAAVGSNLGRWLGLGINDMQTLVACGAAAGIAAIFSAPVGGFLFALELLGVTLTTLPVLAVVTASLTAFLTIYSCDGFAPDLAFPSAGAFSFSTLPMAVALGVVCGLYSLYYSYVLNRMDGVFKSISNPWIRNVSGGLMLGLILFLFPAMYSTGYPIIGKLIEDSPETLLKGSPLLQLGLGELGIIIGAAGILLCKSWAVTATNSSGGVGGDFAPTLFAGSMAGVLFASVCNTCFGTTLPVGLFAFYGMAGCMSGIIQAPLMTIFITLEMTQTWHLALPVSTVALVAYLTVKWGNWADNRNFPIVRHLLWFTGLGEKSASRMDARKGHRP